MSMDDVILGNTAKLGEIDLGIKQGARQGEQIQKSLDRLHDKAIEAEVEGIFDGLFTRVFRWITIALLCVLLVGVWRMNKRLDRLSEPVVQAEPPQAQPRNQKPQQGP
jgi:hypothetical protein